MSTRATSILLLPALLAAVLAAPAAAAPAAPPDDDDSAPAAGGHAVFQSARGPYLLGEVARADILALFPEWEGEEQQYEPDRGAVAFLASIDREVRVVCVLGTWCSDSEREVPRFWKVLAAAGNPRLELQMLAVGRQDDAEKTLPRLQELGFQQDIREGYAVELVPTFIFYHLGEEIGRIVETPQISLETDAAAILSMLMEEPVGP